MNPAFIAALMFLSIFFTGSFAQKEDSELEKILSSIHGDTIRTKLEQMLKRSSNEEINTRIRLELGKLAYAQGLYKKAFELLFDLKSDTAYFFAALAARTLKMDSLSQVISSKITSDELKAYFLISESDQKEPVNIKGYYLQFGAFKEYKKAKILADKIEKRGLTTLIAKKDDLYFVRAGRYKTKNEAELEGETVVPNLIYKIVEE